MKKHLIGIDPGINCGFAETDIYGNLTRVTTLKLWRMLAHLMNFTETFKENVIIRIEDPNTWIPFKGQKHNASRLQGVGGVKQTYKHIIEFLEDNGFQYENTRIHGNYKKLTSAKFKHITGWSSPTNEHGRDSAMLVWDRN
jgi:hypothetical protein